MARSVPPLRVRYRHGAFGTATGFILVDAERTVARSYAGTSAVRNSTARRSE